mmetsp:Transcript_20990/g.25473  ORF Transcript_20990/g.25473 Transcript_20990/m.25473 type:complete len:367 (+) Transcript_20990:136-1236(+)
MNSKLVRLVVAGLVLWFDSLYLVLAGEIPVQILVGLKESVCTNCDKITEKVGINPSGFSPNVFDVPFDEGADVKVKLHKKCIVKVDEKATAESKKLTYSLKEKSGNASCGNGKFVTHLGGCGACSSLHDLATYDAIDLTNIAGQCAFAALIGTPPPTPAPASFPGLLSLLGLGPLPQGLLLLQGNVRAGDPAFLAQLENFLPSAFAFTRGCLMQQIAAQGFSLTPGCADVWAWNQLNSGLKCGFDCVLTFQLNVLPNDPIVFPPPAGTFPKDIFEAGSYCSTCKNTFDGGEPVCDAQASNITSFFPTVEKSPYYLNDCFQCDECIAFPYFLRYGGRSRRNSGLASLINRPPNQVAEIDHVYGLPIV